MVGAGGGGLTTPLLCGERAGHALLVPVTPGQNLILTVATQSGAALWDIRALQLQCDQLSLSWQGEFN